MIPSHLTRPGPRVFAAAMLAAWLGLATVGAGAQTSARIGPNPGTVEVGLGQVRTVVIQLSDAQNAYGIDLIGHFDPNVIELVAAQSSAPLVAGGFIKPDFVVVNQIDNVAGAFQWVATQVNPTADANGSGPVVVLQIRGKALGQTATIQISRIKLVSRTGAPLPVTTELGSVTVVASPVDATSVPLTSAPPANPAPTAPAPTAPAPTAPVPTAPAPTAPAPTAPSAAPTAVPAVTVAAQIVSPTSPVAAPTAPQTQAAATREPIPAPTISAQAATATMPSRPTVPASGVAPQAIAVGTAIVATALPAVTPRVAATPIGNPTLIQRSTEVVAAAPSATARAAADAVADVGSAPAAQAGLAPKAPAAKVALESGANDVAPAAVNRPAETASRSTTGGADALIGVALFLVGIGAAVSFGKADRGRHGNRGGR